MRNGFGSVALLCTLAAPGTLRGRAEVTSAALRSQARSPFMPFQRDLPRIPELLPVSTSRGRDTYEIAIHEGLAEILPGFQTPIYGFEGVYPGSTIRARKGREVVVRKKNTLPFDSNVPCTAAMSLPRTTGTRWT
jgi:FtsP/CotA-like multicopper oxidase with cupredoxin domain